MSSKMKNVTYTLFLTLVTMSTKWFPLALLPIYKISSNVFDVSYIPAWISILF